MGQKAQAAQRAYEARGMSPAKALRRALSRTADVMWDLALVTQSVTVELLDQDGVVEGLSAKDLLVLLDGPDGTIGLASVDRQVMTGVVEVQTIQQVTQMPVDEDRVLTQTDAAMIAPLIDGTLHSMAGALADSPIGEMLQGFRFGAMLEDARSASLLLDAAGYRAFRAQVDLALGRRKGCLSFILPERKPVPRSAEQGGADAAGPHAAILDRVPARLDAVLSRITLPLSRAQTLKPGDVLKLSKDALDRVEIIAGRGHMVAKGRMGQLNGARAVRLTWPVLGPATLAVPAGGSSDTGADFGGDFGNGQLSLPGAGDGETGLPDLPGMTDDGPTMSEDLPDLPPMDFGDNNDFDFESVMSEGEEGEEAEDFGGFATAPMEIDFNE